MAARATSGEISKGVIAVSRGRYVACRGAPMYLPIGDYALIGDCHSAALVSRAGSIDRCCLPRFDSDSCFARLLDHEHGGHFSMAPVGPWTSRREYRGDRLVLVTPFASASCSLR